MMTSVQSPAVNDDNVPPQVLALFGRLHKRAMGTACAVVAAALVFLATVATVLVPGPWHTGLGLLGNFFVGYAVTWTGAFIGAFWAGVAGFVFGWFFAFCRNFFVAVVLFILGTRAELAASEDFLDHI